MQFRLKSDDGEFWLMIDAQAGAEPGDPPEVRFRLEKVPGRWKSPEELRADLLSIVEITDDERRKQAMDAWDVERKRCGG